jgi:uncharacterized protein (TIGR03083 family)
MEISAMLRDQARRVADLIRQVPDPAAPVPGLQWTVAETAVHTVSELRDYARFAAGETVLTTVDGGAAAAGLDDGSAGAAVVNAAANARQLAAWPDRDLGEIADAVLPAVEEFLTAAATRAPDDRVTISNGLSVTISTLAPTLLGELVVHGFDIARAAHRPWPIGRPEALAVIAGVMTMLPDYVDRERSRNLHVSYEVRLRGGPRYRIAINAGAARVSGPGTPVDCVITADPVAFLLVGFGRVSQWGQILRGRLVAAGRKPWLGFSFAKLITGP